MTNEIATESTALAEREEFTAELAPTAGAEAARQEVQAAVVLAKRFPRNEDAAFQQLMKSCQRPTFAADVTYSFPRGGTTITGPSIYLAREFARLWGNIRHGCDVVTDDEQERTIRAWAWDLETNVKVTSDVPFRKLIQRKDKKTGETRWIEPDERDLRELTNKHAAIAKRNCLLELLPSDMVEDAITRARETLLSKAEKDPDELRKNIVTGFGALNIPVANLEAYLGHKIAECSPAELVELRGHWKSIKDGNTTWHEIAAAKVAATSKTDELAATLMSRPIGKETLAVLKKTIKTAEISDAGLAGVLVSLGFRKLDDEATVGLGKLTEEQGRKLIGELETGGK